jgi:hypothetical protein
VTAIVPPVPQGLGPTDLFELFHPVAQYIAGVRNARGLPMIVGGTGDILVGHELLGDNDSPPRIVVVPTVDRFESARPMGGAVGKPGQLADANPKTFYRRWLGFDAHFWGDDDPQGLNPLYGYNAALELEREFLGGLVLNLGNTPNLHLGGARWEQPNDHVREGRLRVLSFEVCTPVTFEPAIVIPFSKTSGDGGVVVSATVRMVFPDGGISSVGPITIPKP